MPKPHPDRPLRDDGWSIRLSTPADRDWLVDLGSRVHPQNHYFNDPWIDPERVRALFGAWMRRCVDGLAYRIYVLESPQGRPAGFVTYLRSPAFAEAVGRRPLILDYVILEPEARGEGRGSRLIGRTLAMESGSGFDYCELRTSQNNYAAAASYEKLGFRLCSTDFALHHLLSDGSDPSEPSRKAQRI
jgi:GNAT superfamily N-acetyltransferase